MTELLVPIDFSEITTAVLNTAARLAKPLAARISLMHVVHGDAIGHHSAVSESWQPVHLESNRPASLHDQAHTPVQPRTVYVSPQDNPQTLHKQAQLQRLEDQLRAQGLTVTAIMAEGKPIEKILEEADRLRDVLIVMGSHGHGALHHLLLGSVSEGVLRKAHCPVVIVPYRAATSSNP
jgi:nucleotide-binding universal stress UspA family protein